MKPYIFLFLAIVITFGCQSQPVENEDTYPTKTHEILKSFYPELKQFYVLNGFCEVDDEIAVGNRNLMLHINKHQNFDHLIKMIFHDSTCQKMQETDIYNTIWDIHVSETTSLVLDEKGISIELITTQDSEYNKWIASNYINFQPFLKNWYWTRSELPSRSSYQFFMREKSELDSIDFADEIFTNTIITEFFIHYLNEYCPFQTIKFDDSQLTKSHKVINSFRPELKQFYVKNDFCRAEDNIAVGNRNFIAHVSKHKSYQYLKTFTIQDSTCKKMKETDIYLKIWKVDTMEVRIGDLDGNNGVLDTLHKEVYHIDTDYYKWIISNYKNVQPTLQSWFYTRLVEFRDIKSTHFLIHSEYGLNKIDYEDEMLTNTIIIEFLIRHLYLNCE